MQHSIPSSAQVVHPVPPAFAEYPAPQLTEAPAPSLCAHVLAVGMQAAHQQGVVSTGRAGRMWCIRDYASMFRLWALVVPRQDRGGYSAGSDEGTSKSSAREKRAREQDPCTQGLRTFAHVGVGRCVAHRLGRVAAARVVVALIWWWVAQAHPRGGGYL